MLKYSFKLIKDLKSFIFSVGHNDIFAHKYCIDPGNLLNIYLLNI